MSYRVGAAFVAIAASLVSPVAAKTLPTVKMSPANQPPQCTTPGRLMAFLRARNPRLKSKFKNIAMDYMRHGRDLGIRWDYAFYQMIVETNSLKFTGDVSYRQNNFAGLGATGGGVRGESFRSVSEGVRAHQQHLMIYAGIYVPDPVADRTRKVQSWGILTKWRKGYRRQITFSDVGSKWAPYDREYALDIQSIADAFYKGHCKRRDPNPEQVAQASGSTGQTTYQQPRYNTDRRAGLGASNVRGARSYNQAYTQPRYKTLNRPSTSAAGAPPANQRTAAIGKFAAPAVKPVTGQKCRVWTASYGGQRAIIIRSKAKGTINYTVLDVNKGREDAETKAYIAAYAKGGQRIEKFPTKNAAMTKAFKLCPEG